MFKISIDHGFLKELQMSGAIDDILADCTMGIAMAYHAIKMDAGEEEGKAFKDALFEAFRNPEIEKQFENCKDAFDANMKRNIHHEARVIKVKPDGEKVDFKKDEPEPEPEPESKKKKEPEDELKKFVDSLEKLAKFLDELDDDGDS